MQGGVEEAAVEEVLGQKVPDLALVAALGRVLGHVLERVPAIEPAHERVRAIEPAHERVLAIEPAHERALAIEPAWRSPCRRDLPFAVR